MKKVTPGLLRKYQQGACTPAEKMLVESWLAEGDSDSEVYPESVEMARWQEKKIWTQIATHIERPGDARFLGRQFLWVAAACFFLMLSGAAWFLLNKQSVTTAIVAQVKRTNTGLAQQKNMILPDSSVVKLNAGSVLEYPEFFSANGRHVKLVQGEAFFDIAKDSSRPFTVQVMDAAIKVLGTRFNVNLRGQHHQAVITLTEGKIAFATAGGEQYILQPGEQIIYDTIARKVARVMHADTTLATAWLSGKLLFRNTAMTEVLQQLELKYAVQFDVKAESISTIPLTASFSNEPLDKVLHMIELASGIHFNKKEHVIQVSK